ncbi:hypothetical protein PFICI_06804 [Pestalotiopsis fici W106-1]|uniref:Uncharacterized protein n=1 Tax=Pestalotiopsis fici (strain W106-1 / CGMCC3.15140) TaxID=1229662 RepID=W3X8T7_PESFW|nr:uncharacterized protein PFICI_06804 [Pestalotiopsis fici W106-1]ETS81802.1 hypothetical protein PFICI_06804 [Pestalotiopsis fici W106-1]
MKRCKDEDFGPALGPGPDCHNFDFTLLFEDCIFSLIPSVIAIIVCAYRASTIFKRSKVISWSLARALKLTSFLLLVIFQLALAAIWSHGSHTRLTLPERVCALVATLSLAVLSDLEHNLIIRPSMINQFYFFSTALLDLARVRTQWLIDDNTITASLMTVVLLLKLVILALESIPKHRHASEKSTATPLERSGMFGRALLSWLNPLLLTGYRKNLALDDLFPLDQDLSGADLTQAFQNTWNGAKKSRKHCLSLAVISNFGMEMLISWIPRSFHIAFTMAKPFLVQTTLNYIMNHQNLPPSYGYGLIGAWGIVYTGIAISDQIFNFLVYRLMVKVRGALVGIIYRDMLNVRAQSNNSSMALTLMSTDVDRICQTGRWLVDLVPNVVQVGIGLYILGIQLGAVCVAPLVVALLSALGAGAIAKSVPVRQKAWIAAIQKRVGITSDILGTMKGVKMLGLSRALAKQIQSLREFELAESKKFRQLQIFLIAMNMLPIFSISAVTFTVYAIVAKISGSTLGITQAFTSLSLLSILMMPVALLVTSLGQIAQSLACLDRIQAFLLLEKRSEYRTGKRTVTRDGSAPPDSQKPDAAIISLKNATFGWAEDKDNATIHNINTEILSSSLTLVVGPVASGKSTLLKSILGETYLLGGTIDVAGQDNIAYCDQDAWILNLPIRQNIVGFSDYREEFYKKVLTACQLDEDLSHLPEGDLSLVGTQGISLSGGQKQRIALARAVYSGKKLVILDDTMKGLDADTSSKCFSALLGRNGLLRTRGTTVIMATHNAQWFPHADRLIVLSEGGTLENYGTFETLRESDDYIRSLQFRNSSDEESEDENDIPTKAESLEETKEVPDLETHEKLQLMPSNKEASATAEEKQRGKVNSSLPYYLRSLMSTTFIVFCSLIVFQTACRIIQPLWLNFWTAANARNPREDPAKWIGIYVLLCVLNIAGMMTQFALFLLRIIPRSAKQLHWAILEVTMHAPMSYFVSTDVGQLVNRFSQDMTLVDFPLPIAMMQTSEMFVAAVGEIILTCVSSGYLAVVVPFLGVILFFIQKFYLRTLRQLRLLDLETKSPVYSFFISSFAGLTTIRAFSWSEKSYNEHIQHLDTSQRPFYLLYCVQRWLTMVLELTVAGLGVLLVGLSVGLRDRVEPGLLGVALTNLSSFGMTMSQVIIFWTELETSLGAITRIREYTEETAREKEGTDEPPPQWPSQGAISISQLSAKFGEHTVLDGIDLDINPGEKVAICGRTGSGKSTLLALLLRLYEPMGGTMTIDGIETSTLEIDTLRERLVTLPQDPLLLSGTVRYNLDPASGVEDDELLAALEKTGLLSVIQDKGGLDADFNADWLSAGQKQLFCLARSMLRQSRVLLLDEATSSLDHQTDEVIQGLLRKEFANWTTIVVAHRLRTVADFDKIVVLKDGKVAEVGSPTALLENGGLFKTLWDLQES